MCICQLETNYTTSTKFNTIDFYSHSVCKLTKVEFL